MLAESICSKNEGMEMVVISAYFLGFLLEKKEKTLEKEKKRNETKSKAATMCCQCHVIPLHSIPFDAVYFFLLFLSQQ